MDRDNILLTPGPLTTTLRTKLAMLKDWGSWDTDFNNLTAIIRSQLLDIINGHQNYEVIPLQGSGTFSVEATVATIVPKDGHLLVLDNGAYCKRMAKLATMMGRQVSVMAQAEDQPIDLTRLTEMLQADPSITHVGLIHCETGTGVINPLNGVSALCKQFSKGLIVDAMSSLGALPINCNQIEFDALISASGKCLEGVPGMGFVYVKKSVLQNCQGNSHSLSMDLYDQYTYMERTGQWRFTPPTHVQSALAEALKQFIEEGGQTARLKRYQENCSALLQGMGELGFKPFLKAEYISPI
ncbi:MAG: 2-aminoethylphosphonate--pyruvate transaminase, partial [Saezia sp.]